MRRRLCTRKPRVLRGTPVYAATLGPISKLVFHTDGSGANPKAPDTWSFNVTEFIRSMVSGAAFIFFGLQVTLMLLTAMRGLRGNVVRWAQAAAAEASALRWSILWLVD